MGNVLPASVNKPTKICFHVFLRTRRCYVQPIWRIIKNAFSSLYSTLQCPITDRWTDALYWHLTVVSLQFHTLWTHRNRKKNPVVVNQTLIQEDLSDGQLHRQATKSSCLEWDLQQLPTWQTTKTLVCICFQNSCPWMDESLMTWDFFPIHRILIPINIYKLPSTQVIRRMHNVIKTIVIINR